MNKRATIAGLLCLAGVLAVIFYFTFRASPHVSDISWMPLRWGLWLDEHDEFRHFVGFSALGVVVFMLKLDPLVEGSRSRFLRRFRSSRNHTGRLGALLVFIYLLELGQLWLPRRDFDWLDVINGWAGVLFAWVLWFGVKYQQR